MLCIKIRNCHLAININLMVCFSLNNIGLFLSNCYNLYWLAAYFAFRFSLTLPFRNFYMWLGSCMLCIFHIRKSVKEKWDHRKSMRENLKSLDLVYSANEVLPIAAPEAASMVWNHGYWQLVYNKCSLIL